MKPSTLWKYIALWLQGAKPQKVGSDVHQLGGDVLIEEPETAVVAGMPLAVRRANVRHESLGIWGLGDRIAQLTRPDQG